jgi:hypothetical protein
LTRAEPERPQPLWQLAVAFALGCLAPVPGFVFGMPGRGEFVPAIWSLGFVAALVAPGWRGFIAMLSGASVSALVLDVSDGTFGLVVLIVLIVTALAAHGALTASVLLAMRRVGWRRGLQDPQVRAGGAVALGLVVIFVWFATELARNPP